MTTPNTPVYLDYNASTPIDSRVRGVVEEWLFDAPSNSGSRTHIFGQRAREAVETSREQVARVIGVSAEEVYFTSGATESNNLAILGLRAYGEQADRKHILTTAIEHKAVLEPVDRLRKDGFDVQILPVNSGGFVEVAAVKEALRRETLLVSVMHANNETGVLQPIQEIAELLEDSDTFFHVDAAQTFGKEVKSLRDATWDFASISGHKIHGPQGVGAISIRRRGVARRPLDPIVFGGGQERGLRPGTVPVALVAGLGMAAELADAEHEERNAVAKRIKERFLSELQQVEHFINGEQSLAQPHVLNVSFPGVDSEALMMALRNEIAISNGSACTSASYAPSHVLSAMGLDDDRISEAVRISWGPGVTAIPSEAIVSAVRNMRIEL